LLGSCFYQARVERPGGNELLPFSSALLDYC
jgi:hypothetical protein